MPFSDAITTSIIDDLEGGLEVGLHTAFQCFIWYDGEVACDIARGEAVPGRPIGIDTTFNLQCGLKPIGALALAGALDRLGVDLNCAVNYFLPEISPGLTVGHLLSHQAGLSEPTAFASYMMDEHRRKQSMSIDSLAELCMPERPAYSEVSAWRIVALILEQIEGRPATATIDSDLSELGLEAIWFQANGYEDPRVDRIGCYYDREAQLPLLHDRLPSFWSPQIPIAIGGYASMSALGRWYVRVLEAYEGEETRCFPSPRSLRLWLGAKQNRRFDETLRRDCSFSLGFMRGLAEHGFGSEPSEHAIGHSGFLGNSFAFADPMARIAAAVFTNGIGGDPRTRSDVLRRARVNQIYRSVS